MRAGRAADRAFWAGLAAAFTTIFTPGFTLGFPPGLVLALATALVAALVGVFVVARVVVRAVLSFRFGAGLFALDRLRAVGPLRVEAAARRGRGRAAAAFLRVRRAAGAALRTRLVGLDVFLAVAEDFRRAEGPGRAGFRRAIEGILLTRL